MVDLTGRIPASATAVTFNLTATGGTAATFVTAWPAGTPRPLASNLNVGAGGTRPNQVTVPVTDRKVSLHNNAGSVHLLLDLAGFYTPEYGASFVPLGPKRVLDSRNGTGTGGTTAPIGAEPLSLDLAGELPPTSTGVLLNVTAIDPTAAGYVTAWSYYHLPELTSTLTVSAGETAANAAAQVSGLTDVTAIAGGRSNGYAVRADGTAWSWGINHDGQLGDGRPCPPAGTCESRVPVRVANIADATGVASFDHGAYALRADGTVWAWGSDSDESLGDDSVASHSRVPVPVQGLTGVSAVSGGSGSGFALVP